MMSSTTPKVHVVDDDAPLREALIFLLGSRGVAATGYDSAEAFLAAFSADMRGCVLTDVRMGGMSGLELHERLKAAGSKLPCIALTGHGDVPMAVEALKKGVHDFIEKPFDGNALVDKLIGAIAFDAEREAREGDARALRARLEQLSARERDVLPLLLAGRMNKMIADELGIAVRTVEVHRARIFEKMGVKSAVELATLLGRSGGTDQAPPGG